MRQESGIIKKIQYGLDISKPILTIQVGSEVKIKDQTGFFISQILEDKNTFLEYGYFEYLIMVAKKESKDDEFVWKRYVARPDVIEYFLKSEVKEFLV